MRHRFPICIDGCLNALASLSTAPVTEQQSDAGTARTARRTGRPNFPQPLNLEAERNVVKDNPATNRHTDSHLRLRPGSHYGPSESQAESFRVGRSNGDEWACEWRSGSGSGGSRPLGSAPPVFFFFFGLGLKLVISMPSIIG